MYQTRTVTQTATQAKRLASRIGAELLQMQVFYGSPSAAMLEKFMVEAEMYLAAGYLDHVRFGFERNGLVVFEVIYTAADATSVNDKPGRIPADVDVKGATWFSFLKQNDRWWRLSASERESFRESLPLRRSFGDEPELAPGVYATGSKYFSEETLGLRREVRR